MILISASCRITKIILSGLPWIKFVFLDLIELRTLGLESLGTHAEVSLPLSKVCVLLSNHHVRNSSKEEGSEYCSLNLSY